MNTWHAKMPEDILRQLETDRSQGLSSDQVQQRLETYGFNTLGRQTQESLLRRFIGQLKDPMILILLAAAALSFIASGGADWAEPVIILVIVIVNACISISQEDSAAKALDALQKMSAPLARAVRGGATLRVEADCLVPGDIILLEAGDLVPADARILSCVNLKADESAMTGESIPVSKQAVDTLPEETGLADRINMVISATVITNGRAVCVVTATGMHTEMGRIAGMLQDAGDTITPLQRRMAEISKTLSAVCLAVCAVMFAVGLLQHKPLPDMFMTAVSLAVAAIPEGLPAIVTIVLALGVQRMVKRNAIIKKLPAVETLGCAGVICSDKTGTLTQNKMTVVDIWTADPACRSQALTIGTLCNDTILTYDSSGGIKAAGDPTETALVAAAHKEGLDKNQLDRVFPRTAELPFDSERKMMSTIHALPGGGYRILTKGAPDVLLSRCETLLASTPLPLNTAARSRISAANAQMACRALRVLAVACRDIPCLPDEISSAQLECALTFVGLVGMIDPPRPEAKQAVARCHEAGIRPVMITGDHKLTAVAIAEELNLFRPGDLAITGEDLDFMPQALLEQDIARFSVFARVSPEHKMRIVKAWQSCGKVVAMTGDGVNDAPALKAADIGCAMGISGTDVAKSASHMILTDDNFATIVHAVAQGRGIYANIKKAVHYLLSCNIGEIITIFAATVFNFRQMPLIPVQLLWLNLVTDSLPALALGMEPVETDVMQQKPRGAGESLFSRAFSFRLAWQGIMVGILTLAAYWLGEAVLTPPAHIDADAIANTMAFATLTLCQLFHAFDVRSENQSLLSMGVFSNPAMNKAFVIGLSLQMAVLLLPPLQRWFSVCPLPLAAWVAVFGLALAPVVICELEKTLRRARDKRSHPDPATRATIVK